MTDEYIQIIQRLNVFIKKYYLNKVLQGLLVLVIFIGLFLLSFSVFEFFSRFSVLFRTMVFYAFIALCVVFMVYAIFIPLNRVLNLQRRISLEKAAEIISKHFKQIEDRFINALQLASSGESNNYSKDLVMASINQKIVEIKPFQFTKAIDYKKSFSYLRFVLLILLLFGIVYIVYPKIFTEGTKRILNPGLVFEEEAPFRFMLLNKSLKIPKGENITIKCQIKGEILPEKVFIQYSGNQFGMKKLNRTEFVYEIKNVNNQFSFQFVSGVYLSNAYSIEVLPSPVVKEFYMSIIPPSYTGEARVELKNIGEYSAPAGSLIQWRFITEQTEEVFFKQDSLERDKVVSNEKGDFKYEKRALQSFGYSVSFKNKFFTGQDILKYSISVIPDAYPEIQMDYLNDSTNLKQFYFKGNIKDDYGFTSLKFKVDLIDQKKNIEIIPVPFSKSNNNQEFYFSFDMSELKLENESEIVFYFEVSDNDQISGAKSTKSREVKFKIPSKEELEKMVEQSKANIKKEMDESKKLAESIFKDINELQKSLYNQNTTAWEKQNTMNRIMQKNSQLENILEKLKKENEFKNNLNNSFVENKEELLDKQKEIQEMLDNLLTDDIKKLLKEIQDMKGKQDDKKFNKLTEELKMNYKDLQKELDRQSELLKRYAIEEKLDFQIKELMEQSFEMKELSEQTKNKDKNSSNEQMEQMKKFDEFQKNMEDIKKMNQEISDPLNIKIPEEKMNKIDQDLQKAMEELNKGNTKESSKMQEQISKDMKDLAEEMQENKDDAMSDQESENIEDIKQSLKNLIKYSVEQESLMERYKNMKGSDPRYKTLSEQQKNLYDDFQIIKDSLNAVAKRSAMVSSMIQQEIKKIDKSNLDVLNQITERNSGKIGLNQQQIMTSANNLALMLNESMDQMMNAKSKAGKSGTRKTKNSKSTPQMGEMKQMQESLKKQLEDIMKSMKEGKGKQEMSQELGKALSKQEMMQKMLMDMMNGEEISPDAQRVLKEISKMLDETKKDILNRNINPTTINRQEEIRTRLLEAENSERKRENEDKRESNENKENLISNPKEILEKFKKTGKFTERIDKGNLKLNNFYQNKYKEYQNNFIK